MLRRFQSAPACIGAHCLLAGLAFGGEKFSRRRQKRPQSRAFTPRSAKSHRSGLLNPVFFSRAKISGKWARSPRRVFPRVKFFWIFLADDYFLTVGDCASFPFRCGIAREIRGGIFISTEKLGVGKFVNANEWWVEIFRLSAFDFDLIMPLLWSSMSKRKIVVFFDRWRLIYIGCFLGWLLQFGL